MNCKSNKLRDAVVLALVVGVGGTGTAIAQEAGTTNLDKIEVTGRASSAPTLKRRSRSSA